MPDSLRMAAWVNEYNAVVQQLFSTNIIIGGQIKISAESDSVESINQQNRILPVNLRWLVVLTGFITGIALLSFLWLSFFGFFLIIGAAVQPSFPRAGRWFLSVWVPLLSVFLVPVGVVGWIETFQGYGTPRTPIGLSLSLAWALAPILLIWCNAALVIEARKERRVTRRAH